METPPPRDEEEYKATWFQRLIFTAGCNVILLLILAGLAVLLLLVFNVLTSIPLQLYLAALVVILLLIFFRLRPKNKS